MIDPTHFVLKPGEVPAEEHFDLDAAGLHTLSGEPITEASSAAASVDAERQSWAGLVPGGKSLSGDGSHSPALRVVVAAETAAAVRAKAASEHMSVSKYLRRLIEHDVAS